MRKLLVSLISIYQIFLSFDRGLLRILTPNGACRFKISCSEYTKQAILEYGTIKGGWMGCKRILSCNPWN